MESIGFLKTILSTLWGAYAYQGLFYMSLLIILAVSKNQWKKYTYAVYSLIVLVGLLNPVSITIAEWLWGNSVAYYCRLFSMIQIIAVIAFAIVLILNKLRALVKPFAVCAVIAIIIVGGNCVYSQDWYAKAENIEKIPEDVKLISEAFEKLNGVVIAAPNSLTSYIRQYDASIKMVTGRDSSTELSRQLESDTPDVGYIMSSAGMLGAEYVIINRSDEAIQCFDNNGYKPWYKSDGFYIYRVSGYDSIRKEYNDANELVSITYLDAQGNSTVNAEGYVTVKYKYNNNYKIEKESFYDIMGNTVKDNYGCYGYKYAYYKNGKVKEKINVDIEGNPYVSLQGYAVIEYKYDSDGNKEVELFYGSDNKPIEIEKGVYGYGYKYNYNYDYTIVDITCLNADGEGTICERGYSMKQKIINNRGLVEQECYYNMTNQLVVINEGYAGVIYEYNNGGQLVKLTYLNESKDVTMNNKNYAIEKRFYNNGKLVERQFYNVNNELTLSTDGFAVVRYFYDSSGTRVAKEYYDTKGEQLWKE